MWSRGWEVIPLFRPVKALPMTSENFVPSSAQWKSHLFSAELHLESLCHLYINPPKAHQLTQSWTTKSQESLLEFSIWRLSVAYRTDRSSIGRGSSYCCSFHGDWPSPVENVHSCNSPWTIWRKGGSSYWSKQNWNMKQIKDCPSWQKGGSQNLSWKC